MGWVLLSFAIVFEVIGTIALRISKGFEVLLPSIVVVLAYAASFLLMSRAVRSVPLSTAYAIWAAIGTALIAVAGIVLFSEKVNPLKVTGLALVIIGVVALNLGEAQH
jgi:small multidrug resistance pump